MSGVLGALNDFSSKMWIVRQAATIQEGTNSPELVHLDLSGDIYPEEHPIEVLAKNVGILAFGPLYFGAAFMRHAAQGLYEGGLQVRAMVGTYQLAKTGDGFNFKQFIKNHTGDFKKAGFTLLQAGKDLAVAGSLIYLQRGNFYGYGSYIRFAAFAGMTYDPYAVRSLLNRAEAWWRPADVAPLSRKQVLSVNGLLPTLEAATAGRISLLSLFRNQRLGNMREKAADDTPRFKNLADKKSD